MIRKLTVPFAMVFVVGLAITGVAVAWLRNTIATIGGKQISDREVKADVTPVRW